MRAARVPQNAAMRFATTLLLLLLAQSPALAPPASKPSSAPATTPARSPSARQSPGVQPPRLIPQDLLDVQNYDIGLSANFNNKTVHLQSELRAIVLKNTPEVAIHFSGPELEKVELNGQKAQYRRDGELLIITVPGGANAEAKINISTEWSGTPGKGMSFLPQAGAPPDVPAFNLHTDGWPDWTRTWLPCVDHPSDRATVHFFMDDSVLTGTKWNFPMITNGEFEPRPVSGARRSWLDVPIPTYLIAIAIGNYQIKSHPAADGGVAYSYYTYPWNADADAAFEPVPDIIQFFDARLGKFPYPHIRFVQIPTRFGGMENAGCVFLSEKGVKPGDGFTSVLAHEYAHQWFGDSIGIADWPEIWLSEGFATYFSHLYMSNRDASLASRMGAAQESLLTNPLLNKKPIVGPEPEQLGELLDPISYQKGACVLHALRRYTGEGAFWNGIAQHVKNNSGRAIRTSDFAREFSAGANMNITYFIEAWTRQAGVPVLSEPASKKAADGRLEIALEQRQAAGVFPCAFDVEITVNNKKMRREIRFETERVARAVFDADHYDSIVIDPDHWVLHR